MLESSTPAARVVALRPVVLQLLTTKSLGDVATRLDVSIGAIRNVRDGKTPQGDTLDRMEAAALREGLVLSSGGGRNDLAAHVMGRVEDLRERVAAAESALRKAMDDMEGLAALLAGEIADDTLPEDEMLSDDDQDEEGAA